MGIITNVIKTKFTTEGANKVVAASDSISREQTRLGQSSASAGRSFAAQSKGLGGLVGAYAGAAATVFALQAAFTALNNAAKAENIVKGTNALAASVAASGPKILKNIKDITNGQLNLAESAQSVNIALSAGFSTNQIDALADAAMKTSRALGRDLTDSLTRLVRGTAKLEPELLDELGIFVRIEPATKKYAKQLGVAVGSLTEYQRRQAFTNATIEEANRKFSSINTSAPSAQQSLEKLNATITDLGNRLGSLIANTLAPLADYFSGELGNALALFGGILLLVFGKAKAIMLGFVNDSLDKVSKGLDKHVTELEKVGASYDALAASQAKFSAAVQQRGGLVPGFGTADIDRTAYFNQRNIPKDMSSRLAAFRNEFKGGQWTSLGIDDLIGKQTELNSILANATIQQHLHGQAMEDAKTMQDALSGAIDKTSTKTKVLTGGLGLLKNAALKLEKAVNFFFKWGSILFAVSSALELFGLDVFGMLFDWLDKLTKKSEQFSSGLAGAFVHAAGGAELLTQRLKAAGATQDDIDNLNTSILDLYNSLESAASKKINLTYGDRQSQIPLEVTRASEDLAYQQKLLEDMKKNPPKDGWFQSSNEKIQAQTALVEDLRITLENAKQELADFQGAKGDGILEEASKRLEELKSRNIAFLSSEDKQSLIMLEGFVKLAKTIPAGGYPIVGGISAVGGLDSVKVAEQLRNKIEPIKDAAGELSHYMVDGFLVPVRDGQADIGAMNEHLRDALVTTQAIGITMTEAFDTFASGNTSIEKLENQIAGIENSRLSRNKELIAYYSSMHMSAIDITKKLDEQNSKEDIRLNILKDTAETMVELQDVSKNIAAAYGSDIKLLDSAVWDGLLSTSGQIATTEAAVAANRSESLALALKYSVVDETRIDTLKTQLDVLKSQLGTSVEQSEEYANLSAEHQKLVEKAQLHDIAMKAVAGSIFSAYVELTKMTKEQETLIEELKRAKDLQVQQTDLDILTQRAALEKTIADNKIASEERALELAKSVNELNDTYLSNSLQQLSSLDKVLSNLKDNKNAPAQYLQDQLSSAKQFSEQFIESVGSPADLVAAYNKVLNLSQKPGKSNKDEVSRQQALVEYEIKGREAIQAKERELFNQETTLILAKIRADIDDNFRQYSILDAQSKLDKAKVEADKANAEAERAILKGQVDSIQGYAIAVDAFGDNVVTFATVLDNFIKALPSWMGAAAGVQIPTAKAIATDVIALGSAAKDNVDTIVDTKLATLDEQIRSIEETTKLKKEQLNQELFALSDLLNDTTKQREVGYAQLLAEQQGKVAALQGEIADLGTAADTANDKLTPLEERLKALFDSLKGHIENALTSLNDLVFYGEGTFSEIVGNMFKGIQQDLFKITIADPLSNMVTKSLFQMGGVTMKGADNADVEISGGKAALLVKIADPLNSLAPTVNADTSIDGADPNNPLGSFISNITSGIQNFFTNLFGQNGFVAQMFSGLFGQGGILSGLLSGLGGIISSIFSSIFFASGGPIKAFAGGGIIQQFAAGGSPMIQNLAGGGHLRDRVPAMLEPGEFVIRRPAARAIGGPALQSMNATGRVDGSAMSAPVINVSNEGSAKEVKSAQPKFDGEKYVIDIVLRDLANNGPLRRTLRGGKA